MEQQNTPPTSGITMIQWAWIVYLLQLAGFFTCGLTDIVGLIINIIKKDDAKRDQMVEAHFRWQIRTFIWSLVWTIIGICTAVFFVGFIILGFVLIWSIYRPLKGMIRLSDDKLV